MSFGEAIRPRARGGMNRFAKTQDLHGSKREIRIFKKFPRGLAMHIAGFLQAYGRPADIIK